MRRMWLIMLCWAGLGYVIGDRVGYSAGIADTKAELRMLLDDMDDEEMDTVNQEYPKWDV